MIEKLSDMPDGVVGVQASGRVTRDEYKETLVPALREQAEAGEIRIVYAIGPELDEFEPGAMLEDAKVGLTMGLGHHSAWKRCALVSDVEWIVKAFHAFAWMAPGEVKTFGFADLDAAKEWAAG